MLGTLPRGAPPPLLAPCGRRDQLQELLWIIQPILEFRTQGLRRQLRRHGEFAGYRIRGDELNLINADGRTLVVA